MDGLFPPSGVISDALAKRIAGQEALDAEDGWHGMRDLEELGAITPQLLEEIDYALTEGNGSEDELEALEAYARAHGIRGRQEGWGDIRPDHSELPPGMVS
ncbi:hypothetical protein ACFY1P_07980 [Streptomyces sp. NPDC001407]|uniref:hypothetical protein n=1 Tax=Streptomyces sp. NPDC001407 TaxID=3364573 RepID=UPI0036B75323